MIKEDRNILYLTQRRKANWIYHILRKKCVLKHVVGGKIEGMRRRGRRGKQLLDDLKDKRRYWNLEEEALDRTRRTRFGRGQRACSKKDCEVNEVGKRDLFAPRSFSANLEFQD
jgi:hypothetical protein